MSYHHTKDFFEGKKRWSRIKDEILGSYMPAYLAKIKGLKRPIYLIDAFAGPGVYEDSKAGSPLIMCQAAEKFAPNLYHAFFVNKSRSYDSRLASIISKHGWTNSTTLIRGDAQDFLKRISSLVYDQSVFLYLDPFGIKDCNFNTIEPFVMRELQFSTEILINLSMPVIHRLAGRDKWLKNPHSQLLHDRHQLLSSILGGDYWKEYLLYEDNMDAKQRELEVVKGYIERLRTGLPYAGYCPVRETSTSQTKYYMIFASRSDDAMMLMNDNMYKAFNRYMNEIQNEGTLFENIDWRDWINTEDIESVIFEYVARYPSKRRVDIWRLIVLDNFMRFDHPTFTKAVSRLVENNLINCSTPIGSPQRKTKRLNDDCVLEPLQSRLI